MDAIFVYSPFPTQAAAEKVARALLERRLVACVNILPHATSMYWWKGEIQTAGEVILIAKTLSRGSEDVRQLIEDMHEYDVPCVASVPVTLNDVFTAWLAREVAGG